MRKLIPIFMGKNISGGLKLSYKKIDKEIRDKVKNRLIKMIFYVFIMVLCLLLVDHLYLHFTSKPKKNKKIKNKEMIITEDVLLNSKTEDIIVDDPLLYIDMGYYYEINKMNKEAIICYEKAVECGVEKQVVYCFLFELYEEEKMYDKLINMGEDILITDPYNLVVNEKLAHFYQRKEKQDIEKARYYSYQVKKIEKINNMMFAAEEGEREKKVNEAIKKYKEIISFDSQCSQVYRKLADLYRKNGEIKLAISNYKMAVKVNPQDTYSKLWLGIILGMRGRKKEAQILLNEVIVVNPKSNNARIAAYVIYYLEDSNINLEDSNIKNKDNAFKLIFEGELDKVINLSKRKVYENSSKFSLSKKQNLLNAC